MAAKPRSPGRAERRSLSAIRQFMVMGVGFALLTGLSVIPVCADVVANRIAFYGMVKVKRTRESGSGAI